VNSIGLRVGIALIARAKAFVGRRRGVRSQRTTPLAPANQVTGRESGALFRALCALFPKQSYSGADL